MAKAKRKLSKTRFQVLSIDLDRSDINPLSGQIEINLEFNLTAGTSKVFNSSTGKEIENKGLVLGYQGENKWRTTTVIPAARDVDSTYNFISRIQQYKHLIAIDTNTATFFSIRFQQDFKVGLGIGIALIYDEQNFELHPFNVPFVSSINCEKPENENWAKAIELMKRNCQCTDPRKIGVIVDSDLGNLAAYNARTAPIIGSYFLPEEYELIFASDKVNDNVFNRMIGECHSISKQLLPRFIEELKKEIDG